MSDAIDEIHRLARERGAARDAMIKQLEAETRMDVSGARSQRYGNYDSQDSNNASTSPLLVENAGFTIETCWPMVANASSDLLETCWPMVTNASSDLLLLGGLNLPSDSSFEVFFQHWFAREHFPTMQMHLQQELQRRANKQGFLFGLAAQVKGAIIANTDRSLQADIWCDYFKRHSPPQFADYLVCRTATMNIGAVAHPCWVTFFGFPGSHASWLLPPWASPYVDCNLLLDELDGRGGIAALLAHTA